MFDGFSESFRMFPPGFVTERLCTKPYTIPNTKVEVKKGTVVVLPVCGIHMDPKIYPNPTNFDPERFNAENKAKRSPYHFIPFGLGPRNCIGNSKLVNCMNYLVIVADP